MPHKHPEKSVTHVLRDVLDGNCLVRIAVNFVPDGVLLLVGAKLVAVLEQKGGKPQIVVYADRNIDEPTHIIPILEGSTDNQLACERLFDKADAAGLKSEDFDETVHKFSASVAADVNNSGIEDQIKYLVEGIGVKQTERQIDELIESQPRKGE